MSFRRRLSQAISKPVQRVFRALRVTASAFRHGFPVGGKADRTKTDQIWRERCQDDPAQWHRWYKANARRRRQLRAWKQRGIGKIDNASADLRRWMVR